MDMTEDTEGREFRSRTGNTNSLDSQERETGSQPGDEQLGAILPDVVYRGQTGSGTGLFGAIW